MKNSLTALVKITEEYHNILINLKEEEATAQVDDKWSPNEHIIHLILSISPIIKALKLPKFQLKLMFGTRKGNSCEYEEVESMYLKALGEGLKAPKEYIPTANKFASNKELYDSWLSKTKDFERLINRLDESDLNKIVLPHPALGKLTISELIHFTLIHTKMHLSKIKV